MPWLLPFSYSADCSHSVAELDSFFLFIVFYLAVLDVLLNFARFRSVDKEVRDRKGLLSSFSDTHAEAYLLNQLCQHRFSTQADVQRTSFCNVLDPQLVLVNREAFLCLFNCRSTDTS